MRFPVLFLLLCLPACLQAAPQRVVSLNLCTDLLLLELLPRSRIAALTELAADPVYSPAAERARGIPVVGQDLEAILSHRPDLVLAAAFSDPYVLQRLQALDIPVARFGIPADIDGSGVFITQVAAALGEPAAGARLWQQLQQRWQQLGAQAAQRPPARVLLYRPGGVTMGPGTLEDRVIAQAGLHNVAAELGLPAWSLLSLERVLQASPDLLLLDDDGRRSDSLAQELGEHPALRAAGIRTQRIPHRHWICPGPALADAVAMLLAVRP